MMILKNNRDLAGIRASCRILSDLLADLKPLVKPGVATRELEEYALGWIRKAGCKPAFLGYMDYPAALCLSINEEVIHGIPGKRIIQEGDLVGIDCGLELDGYFSDAAITVAAGKPLAVHEKLMRVTKECLERGIAAAVEGKRISDISRAVYTLARSNGFGVVKDYCGHGVGFSPHEDPQVPNYPSHGPNPRLKPGMVFAIEPMITMGTDDVRVLSDKWTVVTRDGSWSAHFEHTIAITEEGTEVLTSW